jgi:hypothetical protein
MSEIGSIKISLHVKKHPEEKETKWAVSPRVYAGMNSFPSCEIDRCDYVCANGFSFTAVRVDESKVPNQAAAKVMLDTLGRELGNAFIMGVQRASQGWSFYYPEKTVPFPREVQATDWDRLPWKRQQLSA